MGQVIPLPERPPLPYQSSVVPHCPECRTPMGPRGCQRCANRPIPMPDYVRDELVRLGLREPSTPTDHTEDTNR